MQREKSLYTCLLPERASRKSKVILDGHDLQERESSVTKSTRKKKVRRHRFCPSTTTALRKMEAWEVLLPRGRNFERSRPLSLETCQCSVQPTFTCTQMSKSREFTHDEPCTRLSSSPCIHNTSEDGRELHTQKILQVLDKP